MMDLVHSIAAHQRWLTRRLAVTQEERERGDVPGWVLITLMTAGIVTALWAFAGPTLKDMLDNALKAVKGP